MDSDMTDLYRKDSLSYQLFSVKNINEMDYYHHM